MLGANPPHYSDRRAQFARTGRSSSTGAAESRRYRFRPNEFVDAPWDQRGEYLRRMDAPPPPPPHAAYNRQLSRLSSHRAPQQGPVEVSTVYYHSPPPPSSLNGNPQGGGVYYEQQQRHVLGRTASFTPPGTVLAQTYPRPKAEHHRRNSFSGPEHDYTAHPPPPQHQPQHQPQSRAVMELARQASSRSPVPTFSPPPPVPAAAAPPAHSHSEDMYFEQQQHLHHLQQQQSRMGREAMSRRSRSPAPTAAAPVAAAAAPLRRERSSLSPARLRNWDRHTAAISTTAPVPNAAAVPVGNGISAFPADSLHSHSNSFSSASGGGRSAGMIGPDTLLSSRSHSHSTASSSLSMSLGYSQSGSHSWDDDADDTHSRTSHNNYPQNYPHNYPTHYPPNHRSHHRHHQQHQHPQHQQHQQHQQHHQQQRRVDFEPVSNNNSPLQQSFPTEYAPGMGPGMGTNHSLVHSSQQEDTQSRRPRKSNPKKDIKLLQEMGFTLEQVLDALNVHRGNVEAAANHLVNNAAGAV